jgi:hypothetical protein
MGDFVFDYFWANAAEQLDIKYYPKLIGMSPATPVTGYRFLIAPGEDAGQLTLIILDEIDRFCRNNDISSCSFHYVEPQWKNEVEGLDFTVWQHQSYLWENPGYSSFDDYLQRFNKNQRRNIRRERARLETQRITLKPLTGEEIQPEHFVHMYRFYDRTNAQFGPWGAKYLTEAFFHGLNDFRHRLLLIAAFIAEDPEPVGMSFLLTKGQNLYGRYWGSDRWIDALHFNACYYSPIEWAIDRGIKRFDPGIGSTHKVRRGFRAVANYSLHRYYDERLKLLVETNIDQVNRLEQEQLDALNQKIPFTGER